MKKTLSIIAFVLSGTAYAGSASIEYQTWKNPNTKAETTGMVFSVRENVTQTLIGDVTVSANQSESTKNLGGRTEVGLTQFVGLVGPIAGYIRGATGLKFTNGQNSEGYYSLEPGVSFKSSERSVIRVGYRFRDAYDTDVADTTKTVRVSTTYALTKKDSLGVRYDRVRGDSDQNIIGVNYTRSF